MAEVCWCTLPGPESDSPLLVSSFLSAPSPYPLSDPVPSSFTLPSLSLSLSHAIALSLSSHRQTRESRAPGSHHRLSLSLSAIPLRSPRLLCLSFCSWNPVRKFPRARHQRQDTGAGQTAGEFGISQRTEESFVLFTLLMIDLLLFYKERL